MKSASKQAFFNKLKLILHELSLLKRVVSKKSTAALVTTFGTTKVIARNIGQALSPLPHFFRTDLDKAALAKLWLPILTNWVQDDNILSVGQSGDTDNSNNLIFEKQNETDKKIEHNTHFDTIAASKKHKSQTASAV